MADLIAGQIEALMPELLAAQDAEKAAKAKFDELKSKAAAIIGSPQTVKTVWGSVILCNGRRVVTVTDRVLEQQLKLLKEKGIEQGKCKESWGGNYITIKKSGS